MKERTISLLLEALIEDTGNPAMIADLLAGHCLMKAAKIREKHGSDNEVADKYAHAASLLCEKVPALHRIGF